MRNALFGTKSLFRFIVSALLTLSIFIPRLSHSEINAGFLPSFQLSNDANQPVITYTLNHAMLETVDETPLLRIYADGKVLAHYPVYMKKAGDYQFQLSKPALVALIQSLISDGVLDFDKNSARQYKQQMDEQKRLSSGTAYYVSDSSKTIIKINLQNYRSSVIASPISSLQKKFTWDNLQQDAKRYPGSSALTKAAAGAHKLRTLLDQTSVPSNRQ
ncbi:MAG: hypothetical protein V3V50_06820 [Gammaproteobacteria bacterium]